MAEASVSCVGSKDGEEESPLGSHESVSNLQHRTLEDMMDMSNKEDYVVAIEFRNGCEKVTFFDFEELIIHGDGLYEHPPTIKPNEKDAVMYYSSPPTPACSGILSFLLHEDFSEKAYICDGTKFLLAWEMNAEEKKLEFAISFYIYKNQFTLDELHHEVLLKSTVLPACSHAKRGVSGDDALVINDFPINIQVNIIEEDTNGAINESPRLQLLRHPTRVRAKATATMTSENQAKIIVEFQ